jgi:cytoskeletal protein CcmA (bactofilin family)
LFQQTHVPRAPVLALRVQFSRFTRIRNTGKETHVWNKRDEGYRAQPEPAAPAWDAAPAKTHQQDNAAYKSRAAAVIGPSMKIKGEIISEEELYIDGDVEGVLTCQHAVTVGPSGKVRANIKARDLTILGSVRGNVEIAGKLAIREKGSLVGDVRTTGISIDDGAYFKGGIDIVRPEPAKNGKAQAAPQSAA